MTDEANPWTAPPAASLAPEPAPVFEETRRIRPGLVLAALLALGASIGFALWLGAPQKAAAPVPSAQTAPPPPAPPAPLRFAADDPAPGQVRDAYDEVRAIYINGGPDALVKASADCARRLQQDPSRLDECVAFDIYAGDILPDDGAPDGAAAWFHDAGARDLALARSALPAGADAADRIGQLRALTTMVLPKPKIARPKAAPHRRPAPHAAAKRAPARHRASAHRPWRPKPARRPVVRPAPEASAPANVAAERAPVAAPDLLPPH